MFFAGHCAEDCIFKNISQLTNLETLWLTHKPINPEQVTSITGLTKLHTLGLLGHIADTALPALTTLTALKTLRLEDYNFQTETLQVLCQKYCQLKRLTLNRCKLENTPKEEFIPLAQRYENLELRVDLENCTGMRVWIMFHK